ncbi:hypothetical protein ACLB2K_062755 [Fragaria x ananassa]
MRSSSSYPDLRQDSDWVARDDGWRFYDDTQVSNYRVPDSGQVQRHRRRASWHEEYDITRTKNIPVDNFVIRTEQASPSSTPKAAVSVSPPPSSPPHEVTPPRKSKRTYQAVGEKETRHDDLEVKSSSFRQQPPVPASQSPPEPAALPMYEEVEVKSHKREKNVKKRGVATTKEFLITTLRGKKKRQRQKSVENFETLLNSATASSSSMPLHPPQSPPPPPPPPPPYPPVTSAARMSRTKAQVRPTMTAQKPPLPVKVKSFNIVEDEAANSGGDSPLMSRIPPPPPFIMPELKFVVHGDFVRIKSNNSSRSGSPDLDDEGEDSQTNESSPLSGHESPARPVFCPSPDVNTKADTFIARFRAGLRLEKINSVNERGRSNLGPGSTERLGPI